jgi:hypothetical protein
MALWPEAMPDGETDAGSAEQRDDHGCQSSVHATLL